jgi:hypothetical protein
MPIFENQIFPGVQQMEYVSIGIILVVPFLAQSGVNLSIVDNLLSRLLLVAYVLYNIRCSALCGLLALLAVVTIVLERNFQLLTLLPGQSPTWPTTNPGFPVKGPALMPETETVHYDFPHEEQTTEVGDKMYEVVKDIQDNIPRIDQGPHGSDDSATSFYQSRGLASASD